MGLFSFFTKSPEEQQQALTQGAAETADNVAGGFFSMLWGGIKFVGMALLAITGIAFLTGNGDKVKEMFGGLVKGAQNLAGSAGEKLGITEQTQGDRDLGADGSTIVAAASSGDRTINTKLDFKEYDPDAAPFTNDSSKGAWVTLDLEGNPIAGNSIDRKGDIMSTGKLVSAGVIKEMEENDDLPEGFLDGLNNSQTVQTKSGKRPLVEGWLQNSSNEAADRVLKAVADELGVGQAEVIDRANKIIQEKWGMDQTEIANFSGLTTSWDGSQHRYVREGADSASTPVQLARTTAIIGSRYSDELEPYLSADLSHTGLARHSQYELAKSGTGNGDEDRTSGITKSMVGYDKDTGGAIAVLEQGVSDWSSATEWHAAINSASNSLSQTAIASADVDAPASPATTPQGQQGQSASAAVST